MSSEFKVETTQQSETGRLIQLLEHQNRLLEKKLEIETNWKRRLGMAAIAGLGGVLGATVVVSLLVLILKPFERVDIFKPAVDRIIDQLDRKKP